MMQLRDVEQALGRTVVPIPNGGTLMTRPSAAAPDPLPIRLMAEVVYRFLTNLIYGGANLWQRQVLRTVRGYIADLMRARGWEVPTDPRDT